MSGSRGAGASAVRSSVPPRGLALSVALAWVRAAALAGLFVAVGHAVDRIAASASPAPAVAWLAGLAALAAGATAADALLTATAQARAEGRLRRLVVDAVFARGVVAAGARSGALLSLATNATERAAQYRAAFLGPTAGALTTPFVVLAVYALAVDPLVALAMAGATAVVPLVIAVAQRAVRPAGSAHRREQARLTSAFLEAVQGLGTLAAARAERRAGAELAAQGERHRRSLMRVLAVNQILILVIDAVVSIAVVLLAVLFAVSRVEAGALTTGQGLATILVSLLVIAPVDLVGQFFYIGIGGRASERAIAGLLSRSSARREEAESGGAESGGATAEGSGALAARPGDPAIELVDVTAGWQPDRPVLRDLSLRVARGEHVALVGPSGVGKSTVSALVQAHLRPSAGSVRVSGLRTDAAPEREIRRLLSVVEQRTFLFRGSVADNLRIARPSAGDDELWGALALAGFADEIRASHAGLDTPVGEHGRRLSGGQSQRLAVARAILRDTPVLLLDEPTSQVDLAGEAAFLETLSCLAEGRTVLMIAHRPGAILAADRVVSLAPGGAE